MLIQLALCVAHCFFKHKMEYSTKSVYWIFRSSMYMRYEIRYNYESKIKLWARIMIFIINHATKFLLSQERERERLDAIYFVFLLAQMYPWYVRGTMYLVDREILPCPIWLDHFRSPSTRIAFFKFENKKFHENDSGCNDARQLRESRSWKSNFNVSSLDEEEEVGGHVYERLYKWTNGKTKGAAWKIRHNDDNVSNASTVFTRGKHSVMNDGKELNARMREKQSSNRTRMGKASERLRALCAKRKRL